MSKRIKLTETQVEMLRKHDAIKPNKVIKISEEQYNRLFKPINEGISEDVDTLISTAEFLTHFKELVKHIMTNPSQKGLDPFWVKLGVTWGDIITLFSSMGLITATGLGADAVIKLAPKKEFFLKLRNGGLKRLYNILVEKRYDMKNGGKVITKDEPTPDVVENDLAEETTTASVGGSYEQPAFLAKDKNNARFSKKPAFEKGKILKNNITELDKLSLSRFVVEMDMYVHASDEKQAYVEANNIARAINKKYDASARVTKLKEMAFGSTSTESVVKEGLEDNLIGVEFDDCTKLNNNKEAQEGKCSQGAVDNVVKLKENLYLEVANKTGKTIEEVKTIIERNSNKL
jgi:hypothetical protein